MHRYVSCFFLLGSLLVCLGVMTLTETTAGDVFGTQLEDDNGFFLIIIN